MLTVQQTLAVPFRQPWHAETFDSRTFLVDIDGRSVELICVQAGGRQWTLAEREALAEQICSAVAIASGTDEGETVIRKSGGSDWGNPGC